MCTYIPQFPGNNILTGILRCRSGDEDLALENYSRSKLFEQIATRVRLRAPPSPLRVCQPSQNSEFPRYIPSVQRSNYSTSPTVSSMFAHRGSRVGHIVPPLPISDLHFLPSIQSFPRGIPYIKLQLDVVLLGMAELVLLPNHFT